MNDVVAASSSAEPPAAPAAAAMAVVAAELHRAMPGISDRDLARFVASVTAAGPYALGPDAQRRAGVPQGRLTQHRMEGSSAYPGVARAYSVYVAAQCRHEEPANLIVFQDGAMYLGPAANATVVLDNLIAAAALPPTVAVFVEPGEPGPGLPLYGGLGNRSVEYDAVDDVYARFLVEELLPLVSGLQPLAAEPSRRAICGISSGGNCAFTAAWHRPDAFGKVVCHCGSFTALRGGDAWPGVVRRAERKPLDVFLQTGTHDLDIVFGDWLQANRALAAALAYRGYRHRLVVGRGGHSLVHGGAMLPETLRWLWPASPTGV